MIALGGDANLDGTVNYLDYLTLKRNYGRTGATWAEADFNYDTVVDVYDYLILESYFGQHI